MLARLKGMVVSCERIPRAFDKEPCGHGKIALWFQSVPSPHFRLSNHVSEVIGDWRAFEIEVIKDRLQLCKCRRGTEQLAREYPDYTRSKSRPHREREY